MERAQRHVAVDTRGRDIGEEQRRARTRQRGVAHRGAQPVAQRRHQRGGRGARGDEGERGGGAGERELAKSRHRVGLVARERAKDVGLVTQDLAGYASDLLKNGAIGVVIAGAGGALFVLGLRKLGNRWWLAGAGAATRTYHDVTAGRAAWLALAPRSTRPAMPARTERGLPDHPAFTLAQLDVITSWDGIRPFGLFNLVRLQLDL